MSRTKHVAWRGEDILPLPVGAASKFVQYGGKELSCLFSLMDVELLMPVFHNYAKRLEPFGVSVKKKAQP